MGFRNWQTPAGNAVVVAAATPVDYVGLQVITASDITYTDSLGNVIALTAVPAGTVILCQIVKVTVCSAVVLGFLAR